MEIGAHKASDAGAGAADTIEMLAWIRRIVAFGIRRPGYSQSLQVEQWLEETLREFGLGEVRREPVPVNCWQPSVTAMTFAQGALEHACFPIPYTAWSVNAGIEGPMVFLGEGRPEDFQGVGLRGRIAVFEARFGEVTGASLKQRSLFVRDAHQSVPDGPLHVANWLIRNFDAYYEAQKRGATGIIGLLVDSPIDGCQFYVPYDGHLKALPAVWVGREHATTLRELARANEPVRLVSTGENHVVDSHNIVGIVPGTGRGASDGNESVIVTCHHDAPFASAVEDAS